MFSPVEVSVSVGVSEKYGVSLCVANIAEFLDTFQNFSVSLSHHLFCGLAHPVELN